METFSFFFFFCICSFRILFCLDKMSEQMIKKERKKRRILFYTILFIKFMFCKYSCISDEIILFNMEIAKRSGFCDEDVNIIYIWKSLYTFVHTKNVKLRYQKKKKMFCKENKIEFNFICIILYRNDFMWERTL